VVTEASEWRVFIDRSFVAKNQKKSGHRSVLDWKIDGPFGNAFIVVDGNAMTREIGSIFPELFHAPEVAVRVWCQNCAKRRSDVIFKEPGCGHFDSARTSCQGPSAQAPRVLNHVHYQILYVYERSSQIRIVASQVTAWSCRERTI